MPSRLGLASGIVLGAAIGFGGVGAAALGALADATSLDTTLWVIALTPLPALLLALSLPPTSTTAGCGPRDTKAPLVRGPPCRSWITTESFLPGLCGRAG